MNKSLSPEFKPHPIMVNKDTTWIIMAALASKGSVFTHVMERPTPVGKDPFITLTGKSAHKEKPQQIEAGWESLDQDSETLRTIVGLLQRSPQHNIELTNLVHVLKKSPLFKALDSNSILVTAEQKDEGGRPLTPFMHTMRVSSHSMNEYFGMNDDQVLAQLLAIYHDVAKAIGVNLRHGYTNYDQMSEENYRARLYHEYGKNAAKHTHPKHAYMGAAMLERMLSNLNEKEDLPLSDEEAALLLNLTYHHHHFIYNEKKHGDARDWLKSEITHKLFDTLPGNQFSLLMIRFFALLINLRLADIKATEAHHKHWAGNMVWIRELPAVLKEGLHDYPEVRDGLAELEAIIARLPNDLS